MPFYMRILSGFVTEADSDLGAATGLIRGLDVRQAPGVEGRQVVSIEVSQDQVHWTLYHVPVLEQSSESGESAEDALRVRAETAETEVARLTAALAQVRADRDLLAGPWLATVPMDVLTGILPADRDSRNLLAAVLAAVDLHPNGAEHTDAGRAVIERILADAGGVQCSNW